MGTRFVVGRWGPIFVAALSLLVAAPAHADDPGTTPTTTAATTTTPAETTTTAPATTVATTTTTAPPPPPSAVGRRRSLQHGCPTAAIATVYPKQTPLVLAPPPGRALLSYAAGEVTASVARVQLRGCTSNVVLRSVSLFGSITAELVRVTGDTSTVSGLQVGTAAAVGSRFPLGWGTLVVGERTPTWVAALALKLSHPHGGLPAGTTILVGVGAVPPKPKPKPKPKPETKAVVHHKPKHAKKHKKKHRHKATHEPLKTTPKLGVKKLVFPVVGQGDYVDTYGAFRTDVPGNWHHGDDIFAPLGTPVVAVATGTINRVGWERLGGWRLWVRDTAGDQFYYAHLAGYVAGVLHSKRVERGQVIGFIGNTGDAFTTAPHLHFEVHPRSLLHLGYDGAVNPTTYLDAWPRLTRVAVPHPAHPRLPRAPTLHSEATYVWRELLVARHLVRPKPIAKPRVKIPASAADAGAVAAGPLPRLASHDRGPRNGIVVALVLALAAAAAGTGLLARRR